MKVHLTNRCYELDVLANHDNLFQNVNLMGEITSVSIGSHFGNLIKKKVESGRISSISEVVRAGLRLLEERDQNIEALRQALIEGEESGIVENYDPEEHLAELHRKHKK